MAQPTISQFPANVTMSGYGHAMSLPELSDSQTGSSTIPASSALVQNMNPGESFTVDGYVVVSSINAIGGDNRWWHAVSGYYVPVKFTVEQPASSVSPLTAPPSSTDAVAAVEAASVAAAAANANPLTSLSNFFSGLGADATMLLWLAIVLSVIYIVLKSGALND